MGLGRERRDQRSPRATSRHIIAKRRHALLVDHMATFGPPSQNIFPLLRPFLRHHPIDFGCVVTTAEIPTKVRRLVGRADQSTGLRAVMPRNGTEPVLLEF
jgi:hypothetical protein